MIISNLTFEEEIATTIHKAWDFFSSPHNLRNITPDHMKFTITSDHPEGGKMYPGIIITYRVSPFFGIGLDWVTEITHVKRNVYFIDEQRFGPYKFWHHEHHFLEIPGGVRMTDRLSYSLPWGWVGRWANSLLVEKEINKIFAFRSKKIKELFPPK